MSDNALQRNAALWLISAAVLCGIFVLGLTWCAPAVMKEQEYQTKRLGEALFQEAKYRANKGIINEGF